jgi:hypothetical protein
MGEIGKRGERNSRMPGNHVILYDWYSAAEYWTTSIKQLELIPENPRIVLAAPEVNETCGAGLSTGGSMTLSVVPGNSDT